jgi:hypothetical protein
VSWNSILAETPQGRREFGKPRRRWDDNITMALEEIRCEARD